ncbi:hypothetical protein AZZ61_001470, partial [Klebsiella variicola]
MCIRDRCGPRVDGATPVSYTHLDVYKRQVWAQSRWRNAA